MNVLQNISLKPFNTFGIEQNATWFVEVQQLEEVLEAEKYFNKMNIQPLWLGGGSNILLTRDVPAVIHNGLKGILFEDVDTESVILHAASGEIWHDVVMESVARNLGGIENLSLIPGTMGAAPIQNIGAYGVELTDVFHSLKAVHLKSGEVRIFSKDDCRFGYRNSVFKNEVKGEYFILEVSLRLKRTPEFNLSYWALKEALADIPDEQLSVARISEAVIDIRNSKLPNPAVLGNAGSFFKNPVIAVNQFNELREKFPEIKSFPADHNRLKIPAAWLIEQCGWKGKRIGETGCHKDQALVLVNYGHAVGSDVRDLAHNIMASVQNRFGIVLEPEVNFI